VEAAASLGDVTRSYPVLLLTLSAIWGASYLFIKVGVRAFEPFALVELRLLFAAPILVAFLAWRGELPELRRAVVPGIVLGAINVCIPFALITWGEKHIDSGVAAIANASVPLFVFLLALRFAPGERTGGARLAGLLIGIVGIAVLSGVHPRGGAWVVAGTLAVVLASVSYAAGGLFGQTQTARFSGPVLAAASVLYGALLMLPLSLLQLPGDLGGWKPLASVAALGLAGTGIAQLLLFRILRDHGAARTSLVTYLMPPIALVYGALLLGEPLTAEEVIGMALILLGVGLGSGLLRMSRRVAATQTL
jgi:drug/metabolite transporter (DMT)-like permease